MHRSESFLMKQVALIPRGEHTIDAELCDCIACLQNLGIRVYITHRGQGYAVLWADDAVVSRGTQILWNAGFKAAPVPRIRSLTSGHLTGQFGTSRRPSSRTKTLKTRARTDTSLSTDSAELADRISAVIGDPVELRQPLCRSRNMVRREFEPDNVFSRFEGFSETLIYEPQLGLLVKLNSLQGNCVVRVTTDIEKHSFSFSVLGSVWHALSNE
jgi:hypothetical protein